MLPSLGQGEPEGHAGGGVAGGAGATVEGDDLMGDGQTQAGAGTAAGLVGPVEGVPHVGQRFVGQGR